MQAGLSLCLLHIQHCWKSHVAAQLCFVVLFYIEAPGAPEGLEITEVQRNSITLKWSPPTYDGGAPITGYVIEKRDMKRPTWTSAGKAPKDTTEFCVEKLLEGSEYLFRVIAENKKGQGQPCEISEAVTAKSPYGKGYHK